MVTSVRPSKYGGVEDRLWNTPVWLWIALIDACRKIESVMLIVGCPDASDAPCCHGLSVLAGGGKNGRRSHKLSDLSP
jgi:hypothetical protein